MGQAKLRGTPEERKAKALEAMRDKFPATVTCNNCGASLTEIHPMDVHGLPGIRLAGGAHCNSCGHDTWVLDGTPEGLELAQQFLREQHGADAVRSGVVAKR